MRTLIHYEMKKMLIRRSAKITFLLMLLCICAMSLVQITDQAYWEEGTELSGIPAIHAKRAAEHAQAGPLTAERLRDIMHRYQAVYSDPENLDHKTGALREDVWQEQILPERGILNLIRQVCAPPDEPGTYDMNALSSVNDEKASHFYEIRREKVRTILDMDYTAGSFTQSEKDMVLRMEQEISVPFAYDYAEGWKALLVRHFPLLFLLIGAAVCIIISPLFSCEYQAGTDAVILSAKCGRRETVFAKIGAGFLVTSAVWGTAVLVSCAGVLGAFGIQGWNCDFQILAPTSFYGMKIWQVVLGGLFLNYIVMLSVMAFTMFLSAACKTPFAAVTISILVAMALPATNVHERDGRKQLYAHMRQAAWRRHAPHSECAGLIAGFLSYFVCWFP